MLACPFGGTVTKLSYLTIKSLAIYTAKWYDNSYRGESIYKKGDGL